MGGKITGSLHHSDVTAYTRGAESLRGQLQVETAMCDDFKGGNALGIDSNVVFCMLTVYHIASLQIIANLNKCTAVIVTYNDSQVNGLPNRAACDKYYDIMVGIGEIWAESLATRVQESLIVSATTIVTRVPNGVASSGRMLVVGCVFSIVDMSTATTTLEWKSQSGSSRPYATVYACSHSLSVLCGSLCKFIWTSLMEKHLHYLLEASISNTVISGPVAPEEMGMQCRIFAL